MIPSLKDMKKKLEEINQVLVRPPVGHTNSVGASNVERVDTMLQVEDTNRLVSKITGDVSFKTGNYDCNTFLEWVEDLQSDKEDEKEVDESAPIYAAHTATKVKVYSSHAAHELRLKGMDGAAFEKAMHASGLQAKMEVPHKDGGFIVTYMAPHGEEVKVGDLKLKGIDQSSINHEAAIDKIVAILEPKVQEDKDEDEDDEEEKKKEEEDKDSEKDEKEKEEDKEDDEKEDMKEEDGDEEDKKKEKDVEEDEDEEDHEGADKVAKVDEDEEEKTGEEAVTYAEEGDLIKQVVAHWCEHLHELMADLEISLEEHEDVMPSAVHKHLKEAFELLDKGYDCLEEAKELADEEGEEEESKMTESAVAFKRGNISDVIGSSKVSSIEIDPKVLMKSAEHPVINNENEKGDGKVSREWVFKHVESGAVLSVYDYKETSLYDDRLPSPKEFWNKSKVELSVGGKRAKPEVIAAFKKFLAGEKTESKTYQKKVR